VTVILEEGDEAPANLLATPVGVGEKEGSADHEHRHDGEYSENADPPPA
jgi:hypothetical protein